MVSSSSICCSDSLHSRSASDMYSSSSAEELVGDEGRESTLSKSSLLDMAVAAVVVDAWSLRGRPGPRMVMVMMSGPITSGGA